MALHRAMALEGCCWYLAYVCLFAPTSLFSLLKGLNIYFMRLFDDTLTQSRALLNNILLVKRMFGHSIRTIMF